MPHAFKIRERFQINDAIKELRILRGMSQQQLADKAGMQGRSSICRIENRTDYYPTIPTILDLCKALKIKPSDLFLKAEELTRQAREGNKNVKIEKTSTVNNLQYVRMALSDDADAGAESSY